MSVATLGARASASLTGFLSLLLSPIPTVQTAFSPLYRVGVMMGGRFLGGLAIGVSSLVIPVYLSEFAPASIRGRLVGFYDIGIQVSRSYRAGRRLWCSPADLRFLAPSLFPPSPPSSLSSCLTDRNRRRILDKLRNGSKLGAFENAVATPHHRPAHPCRDSRRWPVLHSRDPSVPHDARRELLYCILSHSTR